MADSETLRDLTADVAPVTDNYPSRISSNIVAELRFIELYDKLMDEDRRLESFRASEQIDRICPPASRNRASRTSATSG